MDEVMRRAVRMSAAIFVVVLLTILAGPFWFLVPIAAATVYFSPRIAKGRSWKMTDEGYETDKAVREFRRHALDGEGPF